MSALWSSCASLSGTDASAGSAWSVCRDGSAAGACPGGSANAWLSSASAPAPRSRPQSRAGSGAIGSVATGSDATGSGVIGSRVTAAGACGLSDLLAAASTKEARKETAAGRWLRRLGGLEVGRLSRLVGSWLRFAQGGLGLGGGLELDGRLDARAASGSAGAAVCAGAACDSGSRCRCHQLAGHAQRHLRSPPRRLDRDRACGVLAPPTPPSFQARRGRCGSRRARRGGGRGRLGRSAPTRAPVAT